MNLKHLKEDDVFHFKKDNAEKEFIVVFESETIIQFDSLSNISSTSLCINKEWDYLGTKEVIKLYSNSK
ncbi:MAG TPA: hypothetical protein VFM99_05260 [Chitinophagales bacterium]|nr:hypothetical protein [Chitinophagales bacterium]